MEVKDKLVTAENGRQICSFCGRAIPKDVQRISFGYSTRYGSSNKRVCGLCILQLADELDKKPIKKWKEKLVVKELEA